MNLEYELNLNGIPIPKFALYLSHIFFNFSTNENMRKEIFDKKENVLFLKKKRKTILMV